jgi:predicted HicB family RNase H-like nuclease
MKKDLLSYNGFYGSVHYSAEDEVFYGKIEGVSDLVTFEGDSVSALKNAFQESVEEYVTLCKKHKKPLMKSYKGSFNVRIDPALHQKAAFIASHEGISLNQLIQRAIEKEVEESTSR